MRLSILAAAAASCLLTATAPVTAQEFPTQDLKLICGFPAGSGADVMYRFMAKQLQAVSGRTVIVENRPGAAGHIATSTVAKSKPDGHTILPAGGAGLASMLYLFKKPPADPLNDFEFLGTVMRQGWFLVVPANSPFKTLQDLTAHLKRKGDKASYATSTATGTVFAETYKVQAGLSAVPVNYKTVVDAVNDLLAGNVDFLMGDPAFTLANIRNGRMRALAISTGQRMKSVPDVPTMAEGGLPGMDLWVWWAVQVPKGTPDYAKKKIEGWFNQILRMPETEKFFTSIGTDVFISTPEQTRQHLLNEIKSWGEYAKRANIKPM